MAGRRFPLPSSGVGNPSVFEYLSMMVVQGSMGDCGTSQQVEDHAMLLPFESVNELNTFDITLRYTTVHLTLRQKRVNLLGHMAVVVFQNNSAINL